MTKTRKNRIYLDYAAATPIDKKVALGIFKIQNKIWGNSSSLHHEGEEAKNVLEKSRMEIAKILNCRANEIYFTSGGTEGLNIAILGIIKARKEKLPHIITSTIEHPAILKPIKFLIESKQVEVSFVSPNKDGEINPDSIRRELKENTILICISHANSEIGVLQPVRKIKEVIQNWKLKTGNPNKPYLLIDASQSALYENISVERLGADLLVLDGTKIYGPRGCGVLFVKKGIKISPLFYGGNQESNLRPGTENVLAAFGFSLALQTAVEDREKESKRLLKIRDYVIQKITEEIPHSSLNGSLENRLPNNINICFFGQDSEFLVIKLDILGFAVSAASACHNISGASYSYVLEALDKVPSGKSKKSCSGSSLRITLGRETKKKDLDELIKALKKIIK